MPLLLTTPPTGKSLMTVLMEVTVSMETLHLNTHSWLMNLWLLQSRCGPVIPPTARSNMRRPIPMDLTCLSHISTLLYLVQTLECSPTQETWQILLTPLWLLLKPYLSRPTSNTVTPPLINSFKWPPQLTIPVTMLPSLLAGTRLWLTIQMP